MRFLKPVFLLTMICTLLGVSMIHAQDATEAVCEAGFHLFERPTLATDPVCMPDKPERIAAVDTFTLETLLALGIQPVSGPFLDTFLHDHAEYTEQLAGIPEIGWPVNPEAIVAAHPDLIISIQPWIKDIADDVAKIAPTVSITYTSDGAWQDVVQTIGAAVGQQDALEAAFTAYQARLTAFKEAAGDIGDVSVVFLLPDQLYPFLTDTFAGKILADAGLKFPEALVEAAKGGDLTDISKERLDLLATSQHIFLVTSGFSDEDRTTYQEMIATLEADPLWQSLSAVKAGHVYVVGRDWIGSSLIAANSVIDDLFTNILGADSLSLSPDPFAVATPEATTQS